jgi:muconate cycloisomerase
MARVSAALDTPVMADESVFSIYDAMKIVRKHAADVLNIKIHKHGGIFNAKKIAAIAESAGLPCMVSNRLSTAVGSAAGAHFAISTANAPYEIEGPGTGQLKLEGDISNEPLTIEKGVMTVPDLPGLGVTVDRNRLKKFQIKEPAFA